MSKINKENQNNYFNSFSKLGATTHDSSTRAKLLPNERYENFFLGNTSTSEKSYTQKITSSLKGNLETAGPEAFRNKQYSNNFQKKDLHSKSNISKSNISESNISESNIAGSNIRESNTTKVTDKPIFLAATSCAKLNTDFANALTQLAQLVANITDSYTTAIFLTANSPQRILNLAAIHSLSRDTISDTSINFGSGLIGWAAENGVRISVCPFEHDATTLRCYTQDQALKSFIAVPTLDPASSEILGVISCDSKKS